MAVISTLVVGIGGCDAIFTYVGGSGTDAGDDGLSPDHGAKDAGGGAPATSDSDKAATDSLPDGVVLKVYQGRKLGVRNPSSNFDELWDLQRCAALRAKRGCDLELSFSFNLRGITTAGKGETLWTEVGIREQGGSNFNPRRFNRHPGGRGVWFVAWARNFATDPVAFNANDGVVAQTSWGLGEKSYDVLDCNKPDQIGPQTGSSSYFGFVFDRGDVGKGHKGNPLAGVGKSYLTQGVYRITACFRALSSTLGTLCYQVNGGSPGIYTRSKSPAMPDLYPVGLSFTGNLKKMQVFIGNGRESRAEGWWQVSDIEVRGCPAR